MRKMVFLGFSPYFIFSSFLIALLLDRGVHGTGSTQFPTSSPWYPSDTAKKSNEESEALKKVLPLVTFDCRGKTGYFPDSKFNCEVFHYCQPDGARNTFHCPAHQLFNQLSMVCEEKNVHNSRLCKEGSISPLKFQKLPTNKKQTHKTSPIFKPALNSSGSDSAPKQVVTLEDLLTYMNNGKEGKESEPTFISRFHKADESQILKISPESAITTPAPNGAPAKDKKPFKSVDVNLKAQGSDQSFSVAKSSSSKHKENVKKKNEAADVSTEYDAIEGRKQRKHKRVGRVLDIDADREPKKEKQTHAHMTERSIEQPPQNEGITPATAGDAESRNSSSPSLFSTDRNKAREFRKRKRYQGRKRKTSTPSSETDASLGATETTTMATMQTARLDFDTLRNNVNRRRKSQRPRTRDDGHKAHKMDKVEPYTLPPLPTPDSERVETTTQSMPREESARSKNPWHKPPTIPTEDDVRFGEKLSDLDQHHTNMKTTMPPPPTAFYGSRDLPSTSEELLGEEYRERLTMQSKHPGETNSSHRAKVKNLNKYSENEGHRYEALPNKPHSVLPENLFPPPRAEAREHHSTPPQEMMLHHDSSSHKSKSQMLHHEPSSHKSKSQKHHHESHAHKSKSQSSSKASTEDPFRVTHPYIEKYQAEVQELKDLEDQRWKADSQKAKSEEKKIAVGSTFFFHNPVTPETTKKPELQIPTTTQTPVTVSLEKVKDVSKHTVAHQHLSKIMNDFFAMSSSNFPGRNPSNTQKEEEDIIVPEYRIPDEDIYASSASAAEDVEEIPPELLEVVDLLTGNEENERGNLKPRASHEIIKIDGPITDSHLEKIFLDDKFGEEFDQHPSEDGSYKKIVVIPQPEEEKEERNTEEVEEFTTLKLEQFLKQLSDDRSLTVIPLKQEPERKRQPTILRAKKIPARVIYRDQLTEVMRPKPTTRRPNIKVVQAHMTSPRMNGFTNERKHNNRPVTHSFSTHSRPQIILHPSSLYPPHPPPLHRKQPSFKIGYPFVSNNMPRTQNTRPVHSRKKRSIIYRLRRQIRQNQHFLPFSRPVYPSFNPKFVPAFSPFKTLFSPTSLHSASSHLTPFTFPGYPIAKPSQNRPHIFRPSHPKPPPVRHISQNGHQTVIVEEVPVPVHVEVPSPSLMRPSPSGSAPAKLPPRYPGHQFRNPSPPAIQTPPLIQRPQGRFPPPPPPRSRPPPNNYRPLGMPSNARPPPPPVNYQSPIPLTGPLPPRITSQGQVYALGVTNKPIIAPFDPLAPRPPNGGVKHSPRNPPRPYNPYSVHANSYPNFPYFQGAFTTPISNEPLPGRVMYSGYKPPKSTTGTKSPKPSNKVNKDRKVSESNSNRSRSKPEQDYFESAMKPMRESHVSYTEEVISRGRPKSKPHKESYSKDYTDLNSPRQSLSKSTSSSDEVQRKRRPGRRRRPRPYSTTQESHLLNDISPTPPPPEQIPPPPADYTSKPTNHEILSSLPSFSEGTKTHETSSHFPPAGYYGKDQLGQFFDSSSKQHQKTTSPKPYHLKSLGEIRASTEQEDSFTSGSMEDGNEPVFGTRLRGKPSERSRKREQKHKQPSQSQTQKNEVRTRPTSRPKEAPEIPKEIQRPNEGNRPQNQVRKERPPPRRRRPPPPRPRNRPPPPPRPQPEIHHFNYNGNLENFYSVPRGLQNLVAPESGPQHGFRGSTDMFGLPHPVIDQSIYSLRPQNAPVDFDPNFFSVPPHVVQQQQSPLHKMNIKPVPESAREFFTAPETGSSAAPEVNANDKKESESRNLPSKSGGQGNEQREPPVRKLRKPKRKNRYNPHSTEQRETPEVNSVKPQTEQITPSSTTRHREKTTTTMSTTAEPRSTTTMNYQSQNDIKETPNVFKQRSPLLPKSLPELSKSLQNGKIDFQKLNATISTSVSVSGAIPQANNSSSEEKENKKVFSSQNGGGLAVVRKGPKRKRARQRVSTTTGVPYMNSESSTDSKYEIAASVLDIIKATTETERQASGYYDNFKSERPSSSRIANTWVEGPTDSKRLHPLT